MRIVPAAGAVLAGSLIVGLLTTPTAPVAAAPGTAVDHGAGQFSQFAAKRVLDTRTGVGGHLGLVASGHTVTFQVARTGVQAAVLDVTVPAPAPSGSLSLYPAGTGWDGRVTMTLTGGGNIQQQLTQRLGTGGGVTIRNNGPRPVHLLVDVLGHYQGGTAGVRGMFAPAHGRVLDTRTGLGVSRAAVGAGRTVTLTVPGHGGVPAGGAVAVIANVAVLSARSTGLLTITDGDRSLATPRLRFVGRAVPQTMQTERILRLGSDGRLSFTNGSASGVQLVVDLFGYFLRDGVEPTYPDLGYYLPESPLSVVPVVLRARRGGVVGLPGGHYQQDLATTMVLSVDRPEQATAIGAYGLLDDWSGSPVVSSSASLQPTEITIATNAFYEVVLQNLSNTGVALHLYVTGYYWVPFGL